MYMPTLWGVLLQCCTHIRNICTSIRPKQCNQSTVWIKACIEQGISPDEQFMLWPTDPLNTWNHTRSNICIIVYTYTPLPRQLIGWVLNPMLARRVISDATQEGSKLWFSLRYAINTIYRNIANRNCEVLGSALAIYLVYQLQTPKVI